MLDELGRIVIPEGVRQELGVEAGTALEVEVREGRIVLSPRGQEPLLRREDGVLVFTGEAVGELDDVVEVQRRRPCRDMTAGNAR